MIVVLIWKEGKQSPSFQRESRRSYRNEACSYQNDSFDETKSKKNRSGIESCHIISKRWRRDIGARVISISKWQVKSYQNGDLPSYRNDRERVISKWQGRPSSIKTIIRTQSASGSFRNDRNGVAWSEKNLYSICKWFSFLNCLNVFLKV